MKLTSQKYAQGIYELTKNKSQEEIKLILQRFVSVLANNHDLSNIDLILKYFARIYNSEANILDLEIISKFKLDDDIITSIKAYISKKTTFQNINVKQVIDENILGSVIIKYNDKVLDLSLNNILQQLKQKMVE